MKQVLNLKFIDNISLHDEIENHYYSWEEAKPGNFWSSSKKEGFSCLPFFDYVSKEDIEKEGNYIRNKKVFVKPRIKIKMIGSDRIITQYYDTFEQAEKVYNTILEKNINIDNRFEIK